MSAWLAGLANFQPGHWPALTYLALTSQDSGDFRLRHWPPREATPFGLPSVAKLTIFVRSDATGLLQLEHTILGLMLNTSGLWHSNKFHILTLGTFRIFVAKRCLKS